MPHLMLRVAFRGKLKQSFIAFTGFNLSWLTIDRFLYAITFVA